MSFRCLYFFGARRAWCDVVSCVRELNLGLAIHKRRVSLFELCVICFVSAQMFLFLLAKRGARHGTSCRCIDTSSAVSCSPFVWVKGPSVSFLVAAEVCIGWGSSNGVCRASVVFVRVFRFFLFCFSVPVAGPIVFSEERRVDVFPRETASGSEHPCFTQVFSAFFAAVTMGYLLSLSVWPVYTT